MPEPAERPNAGSPQFATTHWSVVVAAGGSRNECSQLVLAELCRIFWLPLYVFVRRKGIERHEAEDLTQSFLADFLARNQVSRADPSVGRFRSFLATSLENFLHNEWRRRSALKRGGGQVPLSLDTAKAEESMAAEPACRDTPARAYDRQWARALLHQVMTTLRRQWDSEGRGELLREFEAHLWQDASAVPYAELSARFDLTPVNVRVTFHRLRQQYREQLRLAVAATVADESEVEDELRFLMRVVSQ